MNVKVKAPGKTAVKRLPAWLKECRERTLPVGCWPESRVEVEIVRVYVQWWAYPAFILIEAIQAKELRWYDWPVIPLILLLAWIDYLRRRPAFAEFFEIRRRSIAGE